MALVAPVVTLAYLAVLSLGFLSVGNRILRASRIELPLDREHVLVSIAAGLVSIEILLFLAQFTRHLKTVFVGIALLLCLTLALEWKSIAPRLHRVFHEMLPAAWQGKCLVAIIGLVAAIEFLMAMAPLTGSDALNYHFTVQKQILRNGFTPIFSNSANFLCGQHHLLILFGLALGNEHLALGTIYLGGLLTVASLACLIRRSATDETAALFSLLFLVTPVVFWQMSTSGSPDIFMGFLVCAALILLFPVADTKRWQTMALAGFLIGGVAGAKYTGCAIALAFLVVVIVEFRSVSSGLVFALASIVSGIWPYLRNTIWTGDPFFPFLPFLSPHLVTHYALNNFEGSTGAASSHKFSQFVPFVFFSVLSKTNMGFWDFFGPTVLALAPLVWFGWREFRNTKIPTLVWFMSAIGIFFVSGLQRFLLPVFPIALCCVAAGLTATLRKKSTVVATVAVVIVAAMIIVGVAGLALYSKRPVSAALGILGKKEYLEQASQEYEIVEQINRFLSGSDKKALVFIRHTYYLDVPYLNGDPATSFVVDPAQLATAEQWRQFFDKENIGFVVRSPQFPKVIAGPLTAMEQSGDLIPIAQEQVVGLQGMRIKEERAAFPVVILKVKR